MLKRFLTLLVFCAVIFLIVTVLVIKYISYWSQKTQIVFPAVEFRLEAGEPLGGLARRLEDLKVVDCGICYKIWVRYWSRYDKFQAGRYLIEQAVSPRSITEKLMAGDVYNPIVFQLAVPEGFTIDQIKQRLRQAGYAQDQIDAGFNNLSALKVLVPEATSYEGFFYPATYSFSEQPSIEDILKKALETFQENLPPDYAKALAQRGLNLQQGVTFASLIERETPFVDELPMVSEVIWNRLKSNINLAIDASIIYGIPDYQGNLTRLHLEDRTNPYNTRVNGGLPPGPICSPSRKALDAVLTPSNFGYLYYVLDLETGRHGFSGTLEEHNERVRKLLSDRKKGLVVPAESVDPTATQVILQ